MFNRTQMFENTICLCEIATISQNFENQILVWVLFETLIQFYQVVNHIVLKLM